MGLEKNKGFTFIPREYLLRLLQESIVEKTFHMILLKGVRVSDTTSVWDSVVSDIRQLSKQDILRYELVDYRRAPLFFNSPYWDWSAKIPRIEGTFVFDANTSYDAIALMEDSQSISTMPIDIALLNNKILVDNHNLNNGDTIMIEGDIMPSPLSKGELYLVHEQTNVGFSLTRIDGTIIQLTSKGSNLFLRNANGKLGGIISILPFPVPLIAGIQYRIPLDISIQAMQ